MSEKDNDDAQFLQRADAQIDLANEQLKDSPREGVCASIMFAAARFTVWTNACDLPTGEAMQEQREGAIAYFTEQYRLMLEHHMDDYVENFAKYMTLPAENIDA